MVTWTMIRGAVCSQSINLMRKSTSLRNKQTNKKAIVRKRAWSQQLQVETTRANRAPVRPSKLNWFPSSDYGGRKHIHLLSAQAHERTHLHTQSLRTSLRWCLSTPPVQLCSSIKELSPNSGIAWQGRLKRTTYQSETRTHVNTQLL